MRRFALRLRLPAPVAAPATLALLALLAVLAPALAPDDPLRIDLLRAGLPPGPGHLLGTDRLGRDLLSRWLLGGRTTLGLAAAAAGLAWALGAAVGAVAGYRGGWLGAALARLVDVALAVPIFFVAIALQAALPPGEASVVLVVAATGWMGTARVIRAEVDRVSRLAYVEAAWALGCSDRRVVLRHVLPNCSGALAAALTAGFGEALLVQSTLGFLGLGVPPPAPTWGGMLLDAAPELARGGWWLVLVPGLSILAATAAVGALVEGTNRMDRMRRMRRMSRSRMW